MGVRGFSSIYTIGVIPIKFKKDLYGNHIFVFIIIHNNREIYYNILI